MKEISSYQEQTYVTICMHNIVMCISEYRRGFGLVNRLFGYSPVVNINNFNTFKITVIITLLV
jgi:hypothetical protein